MAKKQVNNEENESSKVRKKLTKGRFYASCTLILFLAVILIVTSYAWFSTTLNVKVKEFNMIVSKNGGLSISFDGINFDTYVEISEEALINQLKNTYPNNTSQWANGGLTPISSLGISDPNSSTFDFYSSSGVRYRNKNKDHGFVTTRLMKPETDRYASNAYIAFDLFFKNVTGSPVSDNLYFDYGTEITMDSDSGEEMKGLVNSMRVGMVKIGTVANTASVDQIQNMTCNNACSSIIYEPNSYNHTELSNERAQKYNIQLVDGQLYPTFAYKKAGGPIYVEDSISGSPSLDPDYFKLQDTIKDSDYDTPLFEIPDGITKARVYVWIEGQDIDSLETDSQGADLSININFIKDTLGYNSFN